MSQPEAEARPRILVVDDNPSIHEDFRKILGAKTAGESRLDDVEINLFGNAVVPAGRGGFQVDSAFQGVDALEMVRKAVADKDPYALAFVDVRMPPGWDGIETLENIWGLAPDLQAVICTAYSDYSWDEMTHRLGHSDNLIILKKPFETVEVLQIAHALTQKWRLGRQAKLRMDDLDRMVRQRTDELVKANENLQREIEERTRAQDDLRVSEARFSTAFQCNPNPMAILSTTDRRFLDANQSFIGLCGYSPEELAQHSDGEQHLWAVDSHADGAVFLPSDRLRNHSCFLRRKDGTMRQIIMAAEPLSLGTTPALLIIIEDITERTKLEAQLRQAQKMEVVGRMAAGIAHEFNNVLTIIQGNVGLLQTVGAHVPDRRGLLDQIMQASQRAASFTRQLLAFSRKQVLQPSVLNLSELVQRLRKMLERLIGEKFEIHLHCSSDLPPVLADEGGVQQILINLVLNARDAMPDGGSIEISTEAVTIDAATAARSDGAHPGHYVCLKVTDHGCGMDTQVLSRIFDPFFTTKEVGRGTGLGLSTIHGIVKQHEGWVDVSSQVDHGSTFRIFLPICDKGESMAAGVVPAKLPVPEARNGETVLVVEDESAVREIACAALQKNGYRVLKAENGPHAIEIWETRPAEIDLLLTDMVMPNGISGGELAKTLQARSPQLKVIYTSGYSPEILGQDSLLTKGINFLPKPYDVQTLLRLVRLCLDGGKLPQYGLRPNNKPEAAGASR